MVPRNETHIFVHLEGLSDPRVLAMLTTILSKLDIIEEHEEAQMADLTQITEEVAQNGDAVQSAIVLLANLAQQIRDAGTDPAALADLASQLDANTSALAEAVVANTTP